MEVLNVISWLLISRSRTLCILRFLVVNFDIYGSSRTLSFTNSNLLVLLCDPRPSKCFSSRTTPEKHGPGKKKRYVAVKGISSHCREGHIDRLTSAKRPPNAAIKRQRNPIAQEHAKEEQL